jgi:hypothetical protein
MFKVVIPLVLGLVTAKRRNFAILIVVIAIVARRPSIHRLEKLLSTLVDGAKERSVATKEEASHPTKERPKEDFQALRSAVLAAQLGQG